jgi:hypothetical protein
MVYLEEARKTAAASSAESRVKHEEPTFRVAGEADSFRVGDDPAIQLALKK